MDFLHVQLHSSHFIFWNCHISTDTSMDLGWVDRRGIQLNYWVSKSFSKLFSKSYLAWCNSIELLKLILKILLRWILLKGHVPTSITALVGNLFQKDFEKDFQNVNRIAKVKNLFLKRDFKKIFKIIFNNSIEFLSWKRRDISCWK